MGEETSTASVPPPVPKIDYLPTEYDVPTISTRNTTSSAPVHFDSASGGATLKRPSKEKKSHRPPPPEDPPPKKKKKKRGGGKGVVKVVKAEVATVDKVTGKA